MNRPTRIGVCSILALAAACSAPKSDVPDAKLNPTSVRLSRGEGPTRLFDRDLTTTISVSEEVVIDLGFHRKSELRRLRIGGAHQVRIEGAGVKAVEVEDGAGWSTTDLEVTDVDRVSLRIQPLGPRAFVGELELWGPSRKLAPFGAEALTRAVSEEPLAFDDALAFPVFPATQVLHPVGSDEGAPCAGFQLGGAYVPGTVRRAWLVYEANGVARPFVLKRSINRQAATGGFWLGGGDPVREVIDELDPAQLTGDDVVHLCLPESAATAVNLSRPRLVLSLDNGRALFDREAEVRLGAALDGDLSTAAKLPDGELSLEPEYPVEAQRAGVVIAGALEAPRITWFDGREWSAMAPVDVSGSAAVSFGAGGARVHAVRMQTDAAGSAGRPPASIAEVSLTGSPASRKNALPKLVLTSPRIRFSGAKIEGEHFGRRAFVTGWTQSAAGAAQVEIAGARVDVEGRFSVELSRSDFPEGEWIVPIVATFPDGTRLTRELHLVDDRERELWEQGRAEGTPGDEERRFGRENQTGWGQIDSAKGGKVTLGTDVFFEAPPGAVSARTRIGITRKAPEAVPRLDAGMINVTAPGDVGYRFQPAGQKFSKAVRIGLPYDVRLLPEDRWASSRSARISTTRSARSGPRCRGSSSTA